MEANKKFETALELVLSEKVEAKDGSKEFKEIAKVNVPCPVLADFGIEATVAMDEKGVAKEEDGIPVFTDDILNWLQAAIINQVKAQSRNKFEKGTLKAGAKLAEDFAELIAVGERSGEALKARHEARKSFVAYLEAQNKTAVVVKLLSDLFHDVNSIQTAQDKFVDALVFHLGNWIPTLSETDKVRFAKKVEGLQEAIDNRSVTMEDLK